MRLVNHPGVRVNEPGLAVNGGPSRPTTRVYAAWDTDPLDPEPLWTDVSEWWLGSYRHAMGRQNEADSFQPGRWAGLFDNTERRLDPRFRGYEAVVDGLAPVAHWRLSDLAERVGGFTLTNTATVFQAGFVGGGASFDGSTSYLETAAFTPAMTGATSVAVLVQGDTFATSARRAFHKGTAGQLDWGVAVTTAGLAQVFFTDAGGTLRTATGTTVLGSGWHLIGGEWDPAAETLTAYVDGRPEKSNQFPGSAPRDTGDVVRIGRSAAAGSQFWDGMLDECSVHSRVLGPDGWAALHRAATGVKDGWFPNVVKGRRVKVVEDWAGVEHPVFGGFVERLPQDWGHPEESTVLLSAVDGFWPLSLAKLYPTAWEQQVRHLGAAHWWGLGEAGPVAVDAIGRAGGSYIEIAQEADGALPTDPSGKGVGISGSDPASTLRPRMEAPGEFLAGPWTVSLWVRMTTVGAFYPLLQSWDGSRWTNAWLGNGVVRLIHWPDPSTALSMQFSATAMVGTAQAHHVVLQYDGTTVKAWVDGVQHVETPVSTPVSGSTLSGPPALSVGVSPMTNVGVLGDGVTDEAVVFDRALTAAEVASLHEAGRAAFSGDTTGQRINRVLDWARWPAAWRSIDPGRTTLQAYSNGGSALAHCQKAAETEGATARFFCGYDGAPTFHDRWRQITPPGTTSLAVFGDTDGEPLHYSSLSPSGDKRIVNRATFSSQGQETQTAFDQDSIDRHFEQGLDRSGLLTDDPAELRSGAELAVALGKDDDWRFDSMVLEPHGAEAGLYPLMLSLGPGDVVTAVAHPPGGGVEEMEVVVEGRVYEVDGMSRRVSLSLSPAPPEFFVWGVTGWGSLWAY